MGLPLPLSKGTKRAFWEAAMIYSTFLFMWAIMTPRKSFSVTSKIKWCHTAAPWNAEIRVWMCWWMCLRTKSEWNCSLEDKCTATFPTLLFRFLPWLCGVLAHIGYLTFGLMLLYIQIRLIKVDFKCLISLIIISHQKMKMKSVGELTGEKRRM